MSSFFNYIYGIMTEPRKTLALLAANRPFASGLAAYFLVVIVGSMAGMVEMQAELPFDVRLSIPAIAIWAAVFSLIMFFVKVGVLHIVSELMGGTGSARGLMTCIGFACFPLILAAPLMLINVFLSAWVAGIITLVLYIWVFVLVILAVRANYFLDGMRAFLVVIMPAIVVVLFAVFSIFTFAAAVIPQIVNLFIG